MNTPSKWGPDLRESVAVTPNTRRRLMTEATRRWPDAPVQVAMWRRIVDGLDALEREEAREVQADPLQGVLRAATDAVEVRRAFDAVRGEQMPSADAADATRTAWSQALVAVEDEVRRAARFLGVAPPEAKTIPDDGAHLLVVPGR